LKLFFIGLAFSFFFWMIGELVRTSPWKRLVTLDGPEFDIFGGGDKSMRLLVGFLLRNLDGCLWMDGCRSEGAPF
jgi:hypothetical protein